MAFFSASALELSDADDYVKRMSHDDQLMLFAHFDSSLRLTASQLEELLASQGAQISRKQVREKELELTDAHYFKDLPESMCSDEFSGTYHCKPRVLIDSSNVFNLSVVMK
jgi:hypothetical protein